MKKNQPTFPTRQEILARIGKQGPRPARLGELMRSFGLAKSHRQAFLNVLQTLIHAGEVVELQGNGYGVPGKTNLLTGRLQRHPDGYGFVMPEQAGETDLFISRRNLADALHGDRVAARVEAVRPDGRREGRILSVVDRGITQLVGRFEPGRDISFVTPTEKRIGWDFWIRPPDTLGAKNGDLVLIEIISYPQSNRNPEGRVIRILGEAYNPKIDTEMVIAEYGFAPEFPAEILRESQAVPETVPAEALRGRRDLRELKTVTIDGERAKDFDDAVSIERLPHDQIRLWVHIADVGHYVPWNTGLDLEARKRGTSVYFPDRVLPMFPERLSNGICSLNPRVDRLTLTAEMLFDAHGKRLEYEIYESVIRSNERMTYTGVKKILADKDPELCRQYDYLLNDFTAMEELCRRLMAVRARDGSIDFDLPEPEIILDLQGQPTDIIREERNIAHRIVEEFMLSANRTVAEHMTHLKIPFLYRTHDPPTPEKIQDFIQFIGGFGHRLGVQKTGSTTAVQPKAFQVLLEHVKGRPEERLINHVMLRSMKQARYTTENVGHFGLAFEHYTHFTSPIRRYPDLIVHRLIKEVQSEGGLPAPRKEALAKLLPSIATSSSERERLAMEAEREAVDLKKLRFLADKEGETFDGFITGVTAFG
ncbi:MAG TPA: ribonuclease R, partial [Nitrospiria bacterium]